MPQKLAPNVSHGEKLLSLFVRLFFSKEKHSLNELSKMLNCSKQTVLKLIEKIGMSFGVNIDTTFIGREKYFQVRLLSGHRPLINLTNSELYSLYMCRAFAEHLLGHKIFEEVTHALDKTSALLPSDQAFSPQHFVSYRPGSIDYTPHQDTIRTLIEAMEKKRVCKAYYTSINAGVTKEFYIKPLKLFSHFDTIYLHASKARTPGKPYKEPLYDPLLAIHRFEKVELTDSSFEFPNNYDFEKIFNQNFGVIKEEAFKVEIEFKGFAAEYVAERIWSPDQKITRKDEVVKLTFTASSRPELIAWILSFGDEAKVIKPKWLLKEIKRLIDNMREVYQNEN